MIVSESQRDESKMSSVGDGSVAASNEPSNPPPYTSNSSAAPSSSTSTAPHPTCNYLLDHKSNGGLKGTWHVDTSLRIPESLLPPITDFDGRWNEEIKKARKRKIPFPSEVRPNLMIMSDQGAVKADVHVASSSNGEPALIVAESKYSSVQLTLDVSPKQISRIHAIANHGEVKVWIPSTFEGALTMGTTYGNIKTSDGIKAKMTTFYSKSNRSRSFIGDWQSAGFGTTASNLQSSNDSKSPVVDDPFTSWPGSTIRIDSTHSSVSLAFVDEKQVQDSSEDRPGPLTTILGGLFGWGASACAKDAPQPQLQPQAQPQQPGPSIEPAPDAWPLDRKVLPPRPSET